MFAPESGKSSFAPGGCNTVYVQTTLTPRHPRTVQSQSTCVLRLEERSRQSSEVLDRGLTQDTEQVEKPSMRAPQDHLAPRDHAGQVMARDIMLKGICMVNESMWPVSYI